MKRVVLVVGLGAWGPVACGDDAPSPPEQAETGTSDAPSTSTTAPSESTGVPPSNDSTTDAPAPFLEVGWGTNEFNAYDGTLPVLVGPQGLNMFSVPLRGQGFYNPPDPSFDNPDMPMFQAWVDIEGFNDSPNGHFNEVIDYPALFYPMLDGGGVLEGPAVWLVLPDSVDPEAITGLAAHLHAELVDADGLQLTDDHDLIVGEISPKPPGP